ncbi:hypothetical protein T06_7822 [Trichinella sp. T6]|nr:hypothetical protein T06_7822 [Trichinella sp. T6]
MSIEYGVNVSNKFAVFLDDDIESMECFVKQTPKPAAVEDRGAVKKEKKVDEKKNTSPGQVAFGKGKENKPGQDNGIKRAAVDRPDERQEVKDRPKQERSHVAPKVQSTAPSFGTFGEERSMARFGDNGRYNRGVGGSRARGRGRYFGGQNNIQGRGRGSGHSNAGFGYGTDNADHDLKAEEPFGTFHSGNFNEESPDGAGHGTGQREGRGRFQNRGRRGFGRGRGFDRGNAGERGGFRSYDKKAQNVDLGANLDGNGDVGKNNEVVASDNNDNYGTKHETIANGDTAEEVAVVREELTLAEYRAKQPPKSKPQFNIRRPGEGEANNWKGFVPLQRSRKQSESEVNGVEEEPGVEIRPNKKEVIPIDISYSDQSARHLRLNRGRGRGFGRGGRGGRGDRGGNRRGGFDGFGGGVHLNRETRQDHVPYSIDDESFPELGSAFFMADATSDKSQIDNVQATVLGHSLPTSFEDGDFKRWLLHFEDCAEANGWSDTIKAKKLPTFQKDL